MLLNKDFYYDKHEQQLQLVTEDVDAATLNILAPVIKKRSSLLYKKPLVREMEGPAQSIRYLEQVYTENKIDQFMLGVDLSSELTGSTLIHPSITQDLERYPSGIKLIMYDASQLSVVSEDDDPQDASAISLVSEVTRLNKRSTAQNPQVERVLRQQVWTKDAVVTYFGRLNKGSLENELSRSETNGLGFLPFLNVRAEKVHDQYLGHAQATGLRKLNEVVNQMLTNLGHIIKLQGFTPIALAGYQSGEGVTIHPGRAFSIPAGANAFVLDTQPKIKEMLDVLMHLEDKMYETKGVPKVAVVGGEGESGRELLIRFFPLMQVFEDKSILYKEYELALANLILRMAGLPSLTSLFINYPEDNILPLSSDEDTLEQDIKLNIKTPVDELLRRDPDLTEEQAKSIILDNKEFNEQLTRSQDAPPPSNDEAGQEEQEDQPESDEEPGSTSKETSQSDKESED
jgi:hypothetical protein